MRIIGGLHRGRALASVGKGDPAAHLRPTTDRVRESVFNVLLGGRFGDPITGARVLDLFAGTGALGLEAVSRGAADVTFVENGRKAQAVLRQNMSMMAVPPSGLIARDATRLGAADKPYDLIFLDPPYGKGMGEKAIAAALAGGWIAPRGLLVWEDSRDPVLPPALTQLDQRRYGDSLVTFARAIPEL